MPRKGLVDFRPLRFLFDILALCISCSDFPMQYHNFPERNIWYNTAEPSKVCHHHIDRILSFYYSTEVIHHCLQSLALFLHRRLPLLCQLHIAVIVYVLELMPIRIPNGTSFFLSMIMIIVTIMVKQWSFNCYVRKKYE